MRGLMPRAATAAPARQYTLYKLPKHPERARQGRLERDTAWAAPKVEASRGQLTWISRRVAHAHYNEHTEHRCKEQQTEEHVVDLPVLKVRPGVRKHMPMVRR